MLKKTEKYKDKTNLKQKTMLVISMATLPIVVVFSGVVDKKAEKNSISYGGLKQLKF